MTADDAAAGSSTESVSAGTYIVPRIPYLRLRCTLAARERAALPPYHGSLLRGAFGHALRSSVCSMGPAQECVSCRLRRACPYTRLFETFIEETPPPFLKGLTTAPRPYVFEPRSAAESFAPGDNLSFDLLLFGQAADLAPYAILAVERMAGAGLGARRARFALERVDAVDAIDRADAGAADGALRPIFAADRGSAAIAAPGSLAGALSFVPPAAADPKDAGASRAVLRFLTPTRLKSGGRLLPGGFGFRELAFAMLRRALEIAHFHVPGAGVDWEIRPFLSRAGAVRVAASDLRWQDWRRYSNRQERSMEMGGFVGTVEIEGDLAPVLPLVRAAEVLHVGKGATFGLGRIAIEPARDRA